MSTLYHISSWNFVPVRLHKKYQFTMRNHLHFCFLKHPFLRTADVEIFSYRIEYLSLSKWLLRVYSSLFMLVDIIVVCTCWNILYLLSWWTIFLVTIRVFWWKMKVPNFIQKLKIFIVIASTSISLLVKSSKITRAFVFPFLV